MLELKFKHRPNWLLHDEANRLFEQQEQTWIPMGQRKNIDSTDVETREKYFMIADYFMKQSGI